MKDQNNIKDWWSDAKTTVNILVTQITMETEPSHLKLLQSK